MTVTNLEIIIQVSNQLPTHFLAKMNQLLLSLQNLELIDPVLTLLLLLDQNDQLSETNYDSK